MKSKAAKVIAVEADKMAGELGNPRLVNTILLGVLSNYIPFETGLWLESLKRHVKARFVDVNLRAFERGRQIKLTAAKA